MSLTSAIVQILVTNAAVAAITTRVRPLVLDDPDALPAIVVTPISEVPTERFGALPGHMTVRVQVDAYAETYDGAETLGAAVYNALQDYSGTSETVVIQIVRQLTASPVFESETGRYRVMRDFEVFHNQ